MQQSTVTGAPSLISSLVRRLTPQQEPPPSPEPEPPGPEELAAEARLRARREATELWEAGRKAVSLEHLRRARLEHGPDTWLCFAYGTRMMQLGHGVPAREALHDAVDLDPTNLDALEFYIEAEHRHPGPPQAVNRVLDHLARTVPVRPGLDADALSFLIPFMNQSDVVAEGVRRVRDSADRLAALTASLALRPLEEWDEVAASEDEQGLVTEATVRALLARGNYTKALEVLSAVPAEDVPVRPLRVAIRRELRRQRHVAAAKLLEQYRRCRPDDTWAQDRLAKLTFNQDELTTNGFPFRSQADTTAYEPHPGRVLYCLHNSLPHHSAGYATRTHGLLRALRQDGWDVAGVTRLGYPYDMPGHDELGAIEPHIEVDGVPYHRLSHEPTLEYKSPIQAYVSRYERALQGLAGETRPFVLHAASNHWNGLAAVQAARALGVPSVYEVRGLWEVTRASREPDWMGSRRYRYMARMEADAAANATRVIAITGALRDELIERGVPEDKITLLPNGVDAKRFVPRERNVELAERLGLTGKTVIGYVGSIVDYEGLELLVDAAAALRQERADFAVLIVGDGATLPGLRERVESERLGDVVIFTGRVPHHDVEDYYSIIDICPFPRLPLPVCEMVSPLKPFEAMAMGKVVVASDVAALAEIVDHGTTGLLHTKGDAASLTAVLRRLLTEEDLRRRLADQGLAWVRQERDWDKLAVRVGEIYEELGGSPSPAP